MDWQATFFILGSLFMLMWLIFLLVLTVSVVVLFQKTRSIQEKVSQKLEEAPFGLFRIVPFLPLVIPLMKRFIFRSRR
jgi:hypothetical protein